MSHYFGPYYTPPPGVQGFRPQYATYLSPPPAAPSMVSTAPLIFSRTPTATPTPPLPVFGPPVTFRSPVVFRPAMLPPFQGHLTLSTVGGGKPEQMGEPERLRPQPKTYDEKVTQKLQIEIMEFERYILPTPNEWAVREWLVNRVTEVVTSIWPSAKVRPFGSYCTGLSLPTSDIDLSIYLDQKQPVSKKSYRHLASKLVNAGIAEWRKLQVIPWAKVPIVHFTDCCSYIECDISINSKSVSTERVLKFLAQYENLRTLFLASKRVLSSKGLVLNPATGGLASYSLMCLWVSFLQVGLGVAGSCGLPVVLEGSLESFKFPNANLGELFLRFFEFYGYDFDWRKMGIILTEGGKYFNKKSLPSGSKLSQPNVLSIQDPDDPATSNRLTYFTAVNVSRATQKINLVQQAFADIFCLLDDRVVALSPYESVLTVLETVIVPSEKETDARQLINRAYDDYLAPRRKGGESSSSSSSYRIMGGSGQRERLYKRESDKDGGRGRGRDRDKDRDRNRDRDKDGKRNRDGENEEKGRSGGENEEKRRKQLDGARGKMAISIDAEASGVCLPETVLSSKPRVLLKRNGQRAPPRNEISLTSLAFATYAQVALTKNAIMSIQPTEQELEQQFQERHANIMNTLDQAQEKLVSGFEGIKDTVHSTLNPSNHSHQDFRQEVHQGPLRDASRVAMAQDESAVRSRVHQQQQQAQEALRDASRVATAQDESAVRSGTPHLFARVGKHVEDTFASDTLTGEEAMQRK
ncbi:hypothetical protein BC937DRAFT_90733 [Endogone sp. FLAS-F59071]|nr:hypothetical protein BC937DRAFT_90733 [Endogone sp. FLAS-F59071]|eukprot:RUS16843.1 hypothetical protein BC937DRAFT_90733 [Endogone sp. FLAS-F59071]